MGEHQTNYNSFMHRVEPPLKRTSFQSVCVSHSLWEGVTDFHAWVEREFFLWMFCVKKYTKTMSENITNSLNDLSLTFTLLIEKKRKVAQLNSKKLSRVPLTT